jgi:hypothetical protein
VSGSFTVGALAIAAPEANAVGAVRLTLLPKRLEVELLRAASYADGFVPGALTRFVRFSVPYTAVRGFVRRGEGVMLTLDPLVATPHSRFFLTHFTDLPLEVLASAHKRRSVARALVPVAPLPLAWAAMQAVPDHLASGVVGRGAVLLVALAVLGWALRHVAGALTFGGPISARLRGAFEHRLSQRVGIVPPATHETDPFDMPELPVGAPAIVRPQRPTVATAPPLVPAARSFRPRAVRLALAFAAVAVGLGLLAGLGAIRQMRPRELAVAEAVVDEGAAADPTSAPAAAAEPGCTCARADSPLWRGGVPVLSVLPIAKRPDPAGSLGDITPVPDRRGVPRYDFDLAIVNNGAEPLRDQRVILTFARTNESGRRVGVTDRGLFWEGELGPARSVKWGVRAPGTEVRIDVDEKREIGAVPPAAPAQFERLLRARQPLVRLHAAMMLAYLGEARAADAARAVRGLSKGDEITRDRIARAASPLRVCDVVTEGARLEACVFNAANAPANAVSIVEVAPDGSGRRRNVAASIQPQRGISVRIEDFGGPAEEIVAIEER